MSYCCSWALDVTGENSRGRAELESEVDAGFKPERDFAWAGQTDQAGVGAVL